MARTDDSGSRPKCTFCGKGRQQVRRLIAGTSGVCICDGCVRLCTELLAEESAAEAGPGPAMGGGSGELPTPQEIFAFLEQYVIGQEAAKRTLAVAVYNHYKRVLAPRDGDAAVEIGKSNILLMGPTGCGKTYLVQTLARMLDVPFALADATTLTEAGYVGEDVENVLLKLLRSADFDVDRARRGIVYIDEIDKVGRKGASPSLVRDVSGEGVQQALLKLVEGTTAAVPRAGGRKDPQQEMVQLDTTDVLFIVGGAFAGLEEIVERRSGGRAVGFTGERQAPAPAPAPAPWDGGHGRDSGHGGRGRVMPQDLMAYGLIPELVGRFPVTAMVRQLGRDDLVRMLTEPRNALLKQYRRLLELDGVELEFTPEAVEAVAEQALLRRTGARGARAVLEEVLLHVMYDVPGRDDVARVVMNRATVLDHVNPTLVPRDTDGGRGGPEERTA